MREGEPNPNNEQNHREKVEINEPLESKELFDLLASAGLKGFRPEFIQELEESGAEKEDVDLATKFMACLAVVNRLVFNDKVELVFSTGEKEPENFVQYSPKKEGKYDENYWISVKHFGKVIRMQMGENREVFLDENGCLTRKGAPVVSLEENLLGIAVHEVRHRLQHKSGIKLIGRGDKVICDGVPVDDEFITLQANFMNSQRKKLKESGVLDESSLERKADKKELDAIIIEKMAVSRLHNRKISLEQLKQIAMIEPEK
jgi:hypothetical protein